MRRPTIKIGDWAIALDLEGTSKIQGCKDVPAYKCSCSDCSFWKKIYAKELPAEIFESLRRLKVDLLQPTDLYFMGGSEERNPLRLVYHCVGKVLSGPCTFKKNEEGETSYTYAIWRKEPYFSFIVYDQKKLPYQDQPGYSTRSASDLIRLDFIFDVNTTGVST